MILTIIKSSHQRQGHGGLRTEATYAVYLDAAFLRAFTEYEHGYTAKREADKYAQRLGGELHCPVYRARMKQKEGA